MKKFFKALALVLALALVIGVVPAQATSAKIKAKKTLYVDGAKGTSTDGKLTSSYKSRVAIYKLAGDKKSVAADHTYKAVIKSGDSVTKTKKYVYAADLGKSVVEIFRDGESLGTSVITVKKNADEKTLTITGLEDGQEVVCGVKTTVTLPRKGVDTDERRLFVDDKEVAEVEGQARVYEVTFTKAGDHKVKFEAFQSAELDKATASNEITVKAVMPQPVSAKQVSANSFAVEFEGSMEGLISKDDITNQMIYYLIASQPVVTGVVKSVEVKDKVVTVTMFANFNNDTDYYFAYGSTDPIKFHTAKNDIKYATSLKLVEANAYYVGQDTAIAYKFYNEDGVELAIDDVPAFEITSDYAYGIGTNIYFHAEGPATIKASIVTGYDDETNKAIVLTDTITVNGVKKTTTQTGKKYSFGTDASKEIHQIRIGAAMQPLTVSYKLSDGNSVTVQSGSDGYYLKSTDETVAMIDETAADKRDLVKGVNTGNATIVLYDSNNTVVDAFPITVLEANKVASATADLSKTTLNTDAGVTDTLTLKIVGLDLDGEKNAGYTATIQQLENNDVATKVTFNGRNAYTVPNANDGVATTSADGKTRVVDLTALTISDSRTDRTQFATVRLVVTVKDGNGTKVLEKTVSFVISEQAPSTANAYKLKANATALDNSVKNWKDAALAEQTATVTVESVKTTSYGDFHIAAEDFYVISSVNNIPVTDAANKKVNYVIASYPTGGTDPLAVATGAAAGLGVSEGDVANVTVTAFPTGTSRTKAGTYGFTGYHVEYGADNKGARTSLGSANVVVSRSDAKATVEIKNGKATNYANNINTAAGMHEIFKVTWEGLTTDDKTSGGVYTDRIVFLPLATDDEYDYQSEAWYCRKIKVAIEIEESHTYVFEQEITVNKLFKND